MPTDDLPRYDWWQTYDWNFQRAPAVRNLSVPQIPGDWEFCGLPVNSPLGVPAGPLLNGKWCLYYASLGFDVLTYKTVRSREQACYALPNLQPVRCDSLRGGERDLCTSETMEGNWAVSFGMPSKAPEVWRADVERTKDSLPAGKLLCVSVVGTMQAGWSIEDLAHDYARCASWAVDSGADAVESNLSCPNVTTCDGQLYQFPTDAALVAQCVRDAIGDTPYVIKVGQVTECERAEALIEAVGDRADALAMTNSIATTVRDKNSRPLFDGHVRGICGKAIRNASTDQVAMFAGLIRERDSELRIVGVGGATKAADVRAYLAAGAHAVHLATAAMVQPSVALEIKRELAARSLTEDNQIEK